MWRKVQSASKRHCGLPWERTNLSFRAHCASFYRRTLKQQRSQWWDSSVDVILTAVKSSSFTVGRPQLPLQWLPTGRQLCDFSGLKSFESLCLLVSEESTELSQTSLRFIKSFSVRSDRAFKNLNRSLDLCSPSSGCLLHRKRIEPRTSSISGR